MRCYRKFGKTQNKIIYTKGERVVGRRTASNLNVFKNR